MQVIEVVQLILCVGCKIMKPIIGEWISLELDSNKYQYVYT